MDQNTNTALLIDESERFAQLEQVVERGQKTFIEVGNALAEIRDSRLYRERYATFEAYCQERWGWARRTAYQYISAAEAAQNVRHGTQAPPTSERQARPLTRLKTSDEQYQAWTRAHEIAEAEQKPVTGKVVEQAVREVSNVAPIRTYQHEPLEQKSKAFRYAQEAIVCLGKIRPQDPNRGEALQSVIDWIKVNR